jgi:hypothetical protein
MPNTPITPEKMDQCTRVAALAAAKSIQQTRTVDKELGGYGQQRDLTENAGNTQSSLAARIGENVFNRCLNGQSIGVRVSKQR